MQGLKFTVSVLKYSSHLKTEGKETITSLAGEKKKEYPLQFRLPVWAVNSEEDALTFCRKACAFLYRHGRAVHAPLNACPWVSAAEEEIRVCAEPARKEPCPVSSRASPTPELERTGGGGGGLQGPCSSDMYEHEGHEREEDPPLHRARLQVGQSRSLQLSFVKRYPIPRQVSQISWGGCFPSSPTLPTAQPAPVPREDWIAVWSVMGCRQPLPLVPQQDV